MGVRKRGAGDLWGRDGTEAVEVRVACKVVEPGSSGADNWLQADSRSFGTRFV